MFDYYLAIQVVCGVWGLSEVAIAIFMRAAADGEAKDRGSARFIYITAYGCVALGVWLGQHGYGALQALPPYVKWIGMGMIFAGVVIRWWAILTLRKFFTVNVAILKDHQLIRKGPYALVRHPAYTGALLSFFGLGVALNSWIAFLVIVIPITTAFFWRMTVEEKALLSAFQGEYEAYSAQTYRLLPWVY